MSVVLVIDIPGATMEQYDTVAEQLEQSGGHLGDGQTYHAAGATDDGVLVVDVWNSREDFDNFFQGRLGEALREAEFPQPQIREVPLHNEARG